MKIAVWLALVFLPALAVAAPKKPATPSFDGAKKSLESFYVDYLNANHKEPVKPALTARGRKLFSRIFNAAIDLNRAICDDKAKDEVRGWGADGDPFLAAQDMDDKLNFRSAKFAMKETDATDPAQKVIEVSFDVFPGQPGSRRTLQYLMKVEDARWVVADLLYVEEGKADSSLNAVKLEIDNLFAP